MSEYTPTTKTCLKCSIEKSLDMFHKQSRGLYGRSSRCKDCRSVYQRTHYEANTEYYREHNRQWAKANPQALALKSNNRRSKIRGSIGVVTVDQWLLLLEMCEYRCVGCNMSNDDLSFPLEKDHILALSHGGENLIGNIQPLCKSCNTRKGNRDTVDYRPENVKQYFMEIMV